MNMPESIEINQGEIVLNLTPENQGKISFSSLGFTDDQLSITGGFLRIVFDLSAVKDHDYYQVPTIEITYDKDLPKTHWQCDFNGETILDKTDHFGHSTVILLNRKTLADLEHHHINKLLLHAEFPEATNLIAEKCFFHIYK
jgi:hypothetical protein